MQYFIIQVWLSGSSGLFLSILVQRCQEFAGAGSSEVLQWCWDRGSGEGWVQEVWPFTCLLKQKSILRERESWCAHAWVKKRTQTLLPVVFISPWWDLSGDPISPAPAPYAALKGCMFFDFCMGHILSSDWVQAGYLICMGSGYIEAGWGMGDIPSLAGSEQPRLVKVGQGALQWDMARGFGVSSPWRGLGSL